MTRGDRHNGSGTAMGRERRRPAAAVVGRWGRTGGRPGERKLGGAVRWVGGWGSVAGRGRGRGMKGGKGGGRERQSDGGRRATAPVPWQGHRRGAGSGRRCASAPAAPDRGEGGGDGGERALFPSEGQYARVGRAEAKAMRGWVWGRGREQRRRRAVGRGAVGTFLGAAPPRCCDGSCGRRGRPFARRCDM